MFSRYNDNCVSQTDLSFALPVRIVDWRHQKNILPSLPGVLLFPLELPVVLSPLGQHVGLDVGGLQHVTLICINLNQSKRTTFVFFL